MASVHTVCGLYVIIHFCAHVNAQTYELNGTTNDRFWTLGAYQEVLRRFVGEHPDFFGARVIFTANR